MVNFILSFVFNLLPICLFSTLQGSHYSDEDSNFNTHQQQHPTATYENFQSLQPYNPNMIKHELEVRNLQNNEESNSYFSLTAPSSRKQGPSLSPKSSFYNNNNHNSYNHQYSFQYPQFQASYYNNRNNQNQNDYDSEDSQSSSTMPNQKPNVGNMENYMPTAMSINGAKVSSMCSRRRTRTKFTKHQTDVLEATFEKTHYPDVNVIDRLAMVLYLAAERISIWFQNRRARTSKLR